MSLLYSVTYHRPDGKMKADFDRDIPIASVMPSPNEVAVARCCNGDRRDVRYIVDSDDGPVEVMPPLWVYEPSKETARAVAATVAHTAVQWSGCVVVSLEHESKAHWYGTGARPTVGPLCVRVDLRSPYRTDRLALYLAVYDAITRANKRDDAETIETTLRRERLGVSLD